MAWIGLHSDARTGDIESTLRRGVLAIGFWGAITLPLIGMPLLAVVPASADVVAIVLGANVVCLLVGQHHNPSNGWLAGSIEHPTVREGAR
ncbi:hypothetical protein [Halorhabdus sp. BNX81]|uniref:hypothetical protein n=1 Tax=Halorhabdus sp. BNX81 TaxID=2980181 RepID=UPI0023DD4C64|nr:hypothetical protein [Halorhabdus sp. BNX81]WEL21977.1 putative membrane protein [Halorhabdus sp. BNX81]